VAVHFDSAYAGLGQSFFKTPSKIHISFLLPKLSKETAIFFKGMLLALNSYKRDGGYSDATYLPG